MTSPAERGEATASTLFRITWQSLVDIVGSGATATLLRRSVRRATAAGVDFTGVVIEQRGIEPGYLLPEEWAKPSTKSIETLRALTTQLRPLLVELTGPVLVARLNENPELRRAHLFADEETK